MVRLALGFLHAVFLTRIVIKADKPPSFISNNSLPADSIGVIAEGNTVTFSCRADGNGQYTYSYIATNLNGSPRNLNLDSRYSIHQDGRLVITNAQHAKDDGYYHCVARNNYGAAISRKAKLRIAYLTIPSSSGSPITISKNVYDIFKFIHSMTDTFPDYPNTTYIWKKGSTPITEDNRIGISQAGNLYIAYLQFSDLGTYTSDVKNAVTSTKYSRPAVTLNLNHKMEPSSLKSIIMLGPLTKDAIHGKKESVLFECFAHGKPMPTITWRKDGQIISSSAKYNIRDYNKRLTIKDVVSSDQGVYSCHVNNPKSAGAGTRSASLTVYVPPTFTTTPSDASQRVLKSTKFSCSATGNPPPQIDWYHNGELVTAGSSARKTINNKELTISSLIDNDRGVVQCVAWNKAGHVTAAARLTIQGVPVWIDVPPKDQTATLGETVELTCQARGTTTPTITWKKDGAFIQLDAPGSRFHVKSSGSIQITNTQKSDSGKYTCVASTPEGSKNASANLRILSKTTISVPLPGTIYAVKGQPKALAFQVARDQGVAVSFSWTKDGSSITDSRFQILSNGSLYITRVQDSDAGTYKCVVTSHLGNATTSGRMVVQEAPLSPTRPVVVQIQTTSVRLSWQPPGYDGNSAIIAYKVESMKEGGVWKAALENINPSSHVTAVVTGLSPNTRYKFRVRAVNSVGVGLPSDATAYVTTYSAPPSQPPNNVYATSASTESILVQWKAPPADTHNGQLQGYRIAYRQSGIQGSSFAIKDITDAFATRGTITGLLRWTEYEIKVQAYNSAGAGPFSQSILRMTGEGAPGAPVQNLKIVRINPSSVELQWEPPPQKQWNGNLKHYKLQAWKPTTPKAIVVKTVNHDSSQLLQRGTLSNLKEYTYYEMIVIAVNGAGDSPKSTQLLAKTQQGLPDAVSSLSISEVYSDGFRVNWGRPTQVNGLLVAYEVQYWRNDSKSLTFRKERIKNDSLAYVSTGLIPRTLYTVNVAAETAAGLGSFRWLNVRTVDSPIHPAPPSNLEVVETRAWEVLLRWTPGFSGRAPITMYKIEYNNDSFYEPITAKWNTGLTVRDAHKVYQLFPLVVPHLRPHTEYRFRVIAINKVGPSPPSNVSQSVTTLEAAPSLPPSDLKVHSREHADELDISWKIPPRASWNSAFIGYKIEFEPSSSSQHILKIEVPNSHQTTYIVGGLLRYTRYKISIKSYNLNGKGASNTTDVFYTTAEGAPTVPPSNVRTKVVSSTEIEVSWGPVPEVGRNGKILGYKISYRVADKTIEKITEIKSSETYSIKISGLESFVVYEFEILAYTRYGPGPRSRVVRAKTLESAPGPPARVHFPEVNKNWLKIAWDPPVYPHGNITGYRVAYQRNDSSGSYERDDSNVAPSRRLLLFTVLTPETYYRFFVWAKTTKGWGPASQEVVYTTDKRVAPDTPFIFPIPTEAIFERAIIIEWRINEHPKNPHRYFKLQFEANSGGWLFYSTDLDAKLRRLKVDGLLPGTRYRFRIKATNDAGDSQYSSTSEEVSTNPTAPTGAPRDVRIKAASSNSLLVEWAAPIPEELGGTLQGFTLKYKEKGSLSFFTVSKLAADVRKYTITGLKVFTTYYIVISAVNQKGSGVFTPELPGTTGELAPIMGPSEVSHGVVTKTSIHIKWKAPPKSTINGYLQGYKVYYEDRTPSRRRRRSIDSCQSNKLPKYIDVDHDKTEATLTHLRKFVTYAIWVRAYNSKGESPKSEVIVATTLPDVPGPITGFEPDAVYNTRVDLSWHDPCEPNGRIISFEITYFKSSDTADKSTITLSPGERSYIITGLKMLTGYTFQIRLKNHVDFGPYSTFVARTKGPAVLPGTPGKPFVRASSDSAVISWQNGHSGNVPFTKFEIQYRIPGRGDFKTQWTIKPEDLRKNKTFVSCIVGNLKPKTSYQFRIISWNKVGKSPVSPPSDISPTSEGVILTPLPMHKTTWFIAVTAVLGVILLLVIIGIIVICIRRRKERKADRLSNAGSSTTRNTLEMNDVRSGSIPALHIAYRDPNEEEVEVSSIGSKEGLSIEEGSEPSGDENYNEKDENKMSFVNHYTNNPSHQSWRNSLHHPGSSRAQYEDDQLISIVDNAPRPRFKSFSSLEDKDMIIPPPPAYESQPEDSNSDEYNDNLPKEAVTSFMSPEYEAEKARSLTRPRSAMLRQPPYSSREGLETSKPPLHDSKSRIGGYKNHRSTDDLRTVPRSSRDRLDNQSYKDPIRDGFVGYGTLPTSISQPRNPNPRNAYRRPRQTTPDSESSEKSSSSNDYRDTRNLLRGKSPGSSKYPRAGYGEEPVGRRRNRPPNLLIGDRNDRRDPNYSHSTSSGTPTSPVSPAPSYHSSYDPYDASNIQYRTLPNRRAAPRLPSYNSSQQAQGPHFQHTIPPRRQPMMYLENGFHEPDPNDDVHISAYQSFV